MIKSNLHKYSVSAMCRVLDLPRSTYYYKAKQKPDESELVMLIKKIFKDSRNNYGTRKIKVELAKLDLEISRRRIGRIMNQEGLVSSYTVAQFKVFNIARSLSKKGCPYDNAVAEATFKIVKTEFVRQYTFDNLDELDLELFDYVNWFNNHRIHSSLNYLTPREYRDTHLKKTV